MRKLVYLWTAAAVSIFLIFATHTSADDQASGPIMGIDLSAAIPVSEFQDVARTGGGVAPFIGYRMRSGRLALTPMIRTQFGFFPTKKQDITFPAGGEPSAGDDRILRRTVIKSDMQTMFAGTGGFRISLLNGPREIYAGGHGGYFTDLRGGPIRGAGPGFSLETGINYDFWNNTALGIFIRRDEAFIPGNLNPEDEQQRLEYLHAGIGLTHLFAKADAPPPPAPPPPPPPPPPTAKPTPAATPEPSAELEIPAVTTTKIVLRGVNFAFDSDRLSSTAIPILEEGASLLNEAGTTNVSIEGHTDSVGSEAYNLGLSRRRAAAVKRYLETHGVSGTRLQTSGFGEERPVASNATADGRAQNRRVELRVID